MQMVEMEQKSPTSSKTSPGSTSGAQPSSPAKSYSIIASNVRKAKANKVGATSCFYIDLGGLLNKSNKFSVKLYFCNYYIYFLQLLYYRRLN